MSTLPRLIVVDVETSGLDVAAHDVLEVAAIDLATGDELYFVPNPINVEWLPAADPDALRINRYFERRVYADQLDVTTTRDRWRALAKMLDGNILAGVNPDFDARFIEAAFSTHSALAPTPFTGRRNHRMRDLATYAAGVLGTDPAEPASSSDIFTSLGIVNDEPHSARGDARATAEAFRRLQATAAQRSRR